jgi:hypothetical protein
MENISCIKVFLECSILNNNYLVFFQNTDRTMLFVNTPAFHRGSNNFYFPTSSKFDKI